jgi:ribonuclease HII
VDAAEKRRLKKLVSFEAQARNEGYRRIAGVDEAGRGPLAGPVVAAVCIIPDGNFFEGINDCKLLSGALRKTLFDQITAHPGIDFAYHVVDHTTIDQINIYQATLQAMRGAVLSLKPEPDYLLVDGTHLPDQNIPYLKIIKGDTLSQSIAAASIIAKVIRDQLMVAYHRQWPEYGFDSHKGYGTKQHLDAIAKYGPCPIHRLTFAPLLKRKKEEKTKEEG